MSYDLKVSFSRWPRDAVGVWRDALARMGVDAEFHPDFEPQHDDNWCPVALGFDDASALPLEEKVRRLKGARVETGFEFYPSETGALFSSKSSEGTLAAFVCACALAAATEGTITDPQNGTSAHGGEGLEVLSAFFAEGAVLEGPHKLVRFTGWDEDDEELTADADADDEEDDDDLEPEL